MVVNNSFFFNDTATTEIYTLSLHDALPILRDRRVAAVEQAEGGRRLAAQRAAAELERAGESVEEDAVRAEIGEHTSELQSRQYLVCRLLLEKKTNPLTTQTSQ